MTSPPTVIVVQHPDRDPDADQVAYVQSLVAAGVRTLTFVGDLEDGAHCDALHAMTAELLHVASAESA